MNRAVSIAFLAIFTLFASESRAFVARGDNIYIDGFTRSSYKYQQGANNDNHLSLDMSRVNLYKDIKLPEEDGYSYLNFSAVWLNSELEIVNANLNWSPFGFIDNITLGRFIPPFAREWSEKSVDQLNLPGGFSPIYDQLVYADDGVQVDFHKKRLYISLGSFLGERSGGVVREQKDGKLHSYAKVILALPASVDLGGSYRYSRTRNNLWAVWAKWGYSGKNISFEAVGFGKDIQHFVNYGVKISSRYLATVRYENLKYQKNRTTFGVRFYTRYVDVKIASVLSGHLAGSPPRWVQAEVLFRF